MIRRLHGREKSFVALPLIRVILFMKFFAGIRDRFCSKCLEHFLVKFKVREAEMEVEAKHTVKMDRFEVPGVRCCRREHFSIFLKDSRTTTFVASTLLAEPEF